MNWDQIQVKWAAMARRVRSDLPETSQVGPDEVPVSRPSGVLPVLPITEFDEMNAG